MRVSAPIMLVVFICIAEACYKAPSSNSPQTQPSNSGSVFSNASSPSSSNSGGDYAKALEAYNAKRYEDAARGFQAVANSDPKNLEAQFHLGKSYGALKKDDDAIKAYKSVISIKPDHTEANLNAGLIEHGRKNYQAAEPFLEQAAKTDYKSTKTLMALGDNQRMLRMYDRAIVQYGKVIGFEPNNAEAYYGLGLTYIGLKNKIGARQQLQKLEPLNKELAKKLSDQIGGL